MKSISSKWWAVAALSLMVIVFSAWRAAGEKQQVFTYAEEEKEDTVRPRKKNGYRNDIRLSDLDYAIREMDKAVIEIDKNLKFDFSKIDTEMKQAMEEIKKIDFDRIGKEINASLKEINWEKTRGEVDKALREAEVKIKEVDMKKVKEELASVKESIDAQKILSHIDIDKIKQSVEEGMTTARREINLLKEFIDTLEKDGLITKKNFKVQVKDGEISINGVKQSKEVNDKYRKYFKDRDNDFTIRNDEDGESIRI